MPKKKFAFKSRKKEAEKPVENEKTEKEEIQEGSKPIFSTVTNLNKYIIN